MLLCAAAAAEKKKITAYVIFSKQRVVYYLLTCKLCKVSARADIGVLKIKRYLHTELKKKVIENIDEWEGINCYIHFTDDFYGNYLKCYGKDDFLHQLQ